MSEQGVIIRKFRSRDREAVRGIIHDTAFMGESGEAFFEGKKILSDALTLYFTDYEPQSCFVSEVNGEVVGCLIGTKDKIASEKTIKDKISLGLLREALASGALFKRKNIIFLFSCLSAMLSGEFRAPELNRAYPATFHINVKNGFRGLGMGSGLLSAYLDYLKTERVLGVHLATMSDAAARFFSKQGFSLLHKGRRSYFRHILHRDVPLYIYGKRL